MSIRFTSGVFFDDMAPLMAALEPPADLQGALDVIMDAIEADQVETAWVMLAEIKWTIAMVIDGPMFVSPAPDLLRRIVGMSADAGKVSAGQVTFLVTPRRSVDVWHYRVQETGGWIWMGDGVGAAVAGKALTITLRAAGS